MESRRLGTLPGGQPSPRRRLPPAAESLRLPVHDHVQARMQSRWGFNLNDRDAAQRAEELLAAAPADPDRLLLAAAVRSSRGDDVTALAAAREAVTAAPASARAHTTLATLLARSGDREAAAQHSARAAELDPGDPVAVYNRGLSRWNEGDRRGARDDFDRVAELLGRPRPRRWWGRQRA